MEFQARDVLFESLVLPDGSGRSRESPRSEQHWEAEPGSRQAGP